MYGISKIICVVGLIKTIVAIPTEESRLISLSPGQSKWMTTTEIYELYKTSNHLHFVDMTEGNWDYLDNNKYASLVAPAFPQNCTQQQIVLPLIANIDRSYILDFLGRFTSFKNRYYKSTYGAQSSQMLYDELLSISQAMGRTDIKLSVSKFAHNWGQFSVVAKLEAVNQIRGYENLVILGGHQDSINQNSPMEDDDASGVVNNLSVLRLLISSSFVPLRPIEFQFYSGEEAGLLGSQAIVKSYVSNKTPVYAQLQTDMTGYAGKTPNIAIVTDYTNSELTNTLRMLAKTYSKLPVVDTRCGYGCSDHASWNRAGISSAFHFETKMNSDNPNIHTPKDTLQFVSLNHVAEFIKTSLGFAVELSLFKQ